MSDNKKHITSIGGQAVIEGVMMRGPENISVAVRKPDGEIVIDVKQVNSIFKKYKWLKIPILRGCVSFFDSMVTGVKALMYSAEFFDLEDEAEQIPSKFEQFLTDKLGDKLKNVIIYFSVFISLIFSIGVFMLLPKVIVEGVSWLINNLLPNTMLASSRLLMSLIEGIIRISIFLVYIVLVSKMEDIQRVFEYHGAEHKSIFCYEEGEELTPENVKKYTRLHPRCGTSFLLFVMVISIILFSLIPKVSILPSLGMRLLLMPVVAGLAYEVIKFAGKSKMKCVAILIKPGLWLQKLTTREPDEQQLEVAIAALKAVIPENKDDDKW